MLSSDIARQSYALIIHIISKKDNAAKREKCQVNVSKNPINGNLPLNNDVNNDKQQTI